MRRIRIFLYGIGVLPYPVEIMQEAKQYAEHSPVEAFLAGYSRCQRQLGITTPIPAAMYIQALKYGCPRKAYRQGWKHCNDSHVPKS